jgi:uridine monophosphate synthetase
MDEKKTNLCLAADVTEAKKLLEIADQLGPEICVFKTHIDIIENFTDELVIELQRLSEKHNFLFFEDRKFADIGNTVALQYEGGVYHIADWAHITNSHTVAGPGSIEGLKSVGLRKGRGLLVLAEMTPQGNLAKGDYTTASIQMARDHADFVIGFITTRKLVDEPNFINFTPGVKLEGGTDKFGQIYQTPASAIAGGSDIIIVGRGIYEAADPIAEAKKYREAGWSAYKQRIG